MMALCRSFAQLLRQQQVVGMRSDLDGFETHQCKMGSFAESP